MSGATVLFMDLVGFSNKATCDQRRLIDGLTNEVCYQLRTYLNPPLTNPSVVALPTGDGLAIVFLHTPSHEWRGELFQLIYRLMQWSADESTDQFSVHLRMGVHVGPVEIITDINGRPNVCGDTINYCQRVMDAANPMQVLFSESAYRCYVGAETASLLLDRGRGKQLEVRFEGPFEVFAKHRLQIPVYKAVFVSKPSLCSDEDPIAKHLMLVTLSRLPKAIVGSFSDRVKCASDIAFIQLTGQRFLEKAVAGKVEFAAGLTRFWVFMPNPDTLSNYPKALVKRDLLQHYIEKWNVFLLELKTKHPKASFKLGLFKEPPYFGASFINWERPGGFIHVSPYIWGVQAGDCPGYDLEWVGKKPSLVYERYIEGLNYLVECSNDMISDSALCE